jgi:hypothetical protein
MSETYSILYSDSEGDIFYTEHAVDWNWLVKGRWACSEKELGSGWYLAGELDSGAYQALLEHFGLNATEFPLEKVISMSPAELAAHRREKEKKYGLGRKEMVNQKLGDHQPAEVFS